jgi:glycosyltransferase involved in cell wall biosynthesis
MTCIYVWVHHTAQCEVNTGVQRVVRNVCVALRAEGRRIVPVRWCDTREALVRAEAPLVEALARFGGPVLPALPEGGDPLHLTEADRGRLEGAWLLMPEVPHVAGEGAPNLALALDYARYYGLRTAVIFYDLIPLRIAGYEAMATDHARYAAAIAAADLVLGISAHATEDLRRWWAEQGHDPAQLPRLLPCPLPEEVLGLPRARESKDPPAPPVRFLALGTIEPRKNQLTAMRAFAQLCQERPDLDIRLDLVGHLHPAVAKEVQGLIRAQPRMVLHGYRPDDEVSRMTGETHATVFISLEEGYGLPVAESLWRGRPCLCSDNGAVAEIAAGGGCLVVAPDDVGAIRLAFERLATDSALRHRLTQEACTRPLRSWRDYACAVLAAMGSTPPLGRLAVLEGSLGGGGALTDELTAAGVSVRRLHWRPECQALLPGASDSPDAALVGAGRLQGWWAILAEETCASAAEAQELLAYARGLGLRVAVQGSTGSDPMRLAQADVALFPDTVVRDTALAVALRTVPRTVGLRGRFRTGHGAAALPAIAGDLPRLAAAGRPQPPRRILYWTGLTATQPFNTGIQRVTRQLGAALQRNGVELVPVGWDEAARCMVPIGPDGLVNLSGWSGPQFVSPPALPAELSGEWLLLPEVTVPLVPPGLGVPALARSLGMRVAAIFYDLIPAKMPDLFVPAAREHFAAFWRGFAELDIAMPISWTVAGDLERWLTAEGLRAPRMVPCPLAADIGGTPRVTTPAAPPGPGEPLRLLVVGTWEPRKNYPRLLRALLAAQQRSARAIRLTVAGRRGVFAELDAEIEQLASAAGVEVRDHVSEDDLLRLHQDAHAAVFASWEEGFGLPVVESLWRGRPCLCHNGSAMLELVPGGGVLTADMQDETAITDALLRLAQEPELLTRLGREAITRPLRSWDEYAQDVLQAMSAVAAPGWPLPAIAQRRPLLTCAITTYNRARWLSHSLPRLLEVTRPWRDVVEVAVCDNTSTDNTPEVIARFQGERNFVASRNSANLGMLGNLGATARMSNGAFVWLLGDDDLVTDGALENVLEGLARHPDVEMAYMNYCYTSFDNPERLADISGLLADAKPIAPGGSNRWVPQLREVSGLNENLFTAIYACAFRRDHALRAYQLDTRGSPFSSLATCVPSSVYALAALQDRPAWWVGEPAVVVNMNVSWLRWALLWHLERMPDLFEEAERQGVNPARLDGFRLQHLVEAERWVRMVYFEAEDAIRVNFSMARLLERCRHLPEFRTLHLPGVRRVYEEAYARGRVVLDPVPPVELFARFGL